MAPTCPIPYHPLTVLEARKVAQGARLRSLNESLVVLDSVRPRTDASRAASAKVYAEMRTVCEEMDALDAEAELVTA